MFIDLEVERVLASESGNQQLSLLLAFLQEHPELTPKPRGRVPEGSLRHLEAIVNYYQQGRKPNLPSQPATQPDQAVIAVLECWFGSAAESAFKNHLAGMAAENFVGGVLEEYLATVLEPYGWVWCAGSSVKSVDFILRLDDDSGWLALQVKNRDNSENSSSSAIRAGTKIEKWFRTFSKRPAPEQNWPAFPFRETLPAESQAQLTENAFQEYAKQAFLDRARGVGLID